MNVYIDLSEFMKIEAITGIQRVVREIVLRFIKNQNFTTILLAYSESADYFRVIDNKKFLDCFENEVGDRWSVYSNICMDIGELEAGAVFFEIDVAWTSVLKRSYLLPRLKRQGLLIVAQIYDIMAITHFQYFTEHFSYTFMEFIGAHLQYADSIIVSTKASLEILEDFAQQLGIHKINGVVAHLGSDFQAKTETVQTVNKEIKKVADPRKYILMVGTIEPRKNHDLVLKAFDQGLDQLGYHLIFAGRIGWNNETFLKTLQTHPMYNKKIFHIQGAANIDIDYLYRKAKIVAFPTHMEGFGLPLVEALGRGVPVIATDIDVLREIGGEYCYYFKDNDVMDFVRRVGEVERDNARYEKKRAALQSYHPVTWDQTATIMAHAIIDTIRKDEPITC